MVLYQILFLISLIRDLLWEIGYLIELEKQ